MRSVAIAALTVLTSAFFFALSAFAQEVLPFPPTPSASVAGRTMQESTMHWRQTPVRLTNPPNILIIMLDDAGFAQADTYGGLIHTPTLSRIAQTGIQQLSPRC